MDVVLNLFGCLSHQVLASLRTCQRLCWQQEVFERRSGTNCPLQQHTSQCLWSQFQSESLLLNSFPLYLFRFFFRLSPTLFPCLCANMQIHLTLRNNKQNKKQQTMMEECVSFRFIHCRQGHPTRASAHNSLHQTAHNIRPLRESSLQAYRKMPVSPTRRCGSDLCLSPLASVQGG